MLCQFLHQLLLFNFEYASGTKGLKMSCWLSPRFEGVDEIHVGLSIRKYPINDSLIHPNRE